MLLMYSFNILTIVWLTLIHYHFIAHRWSKTQCEMRSRDGTCLSCINNLIGVVVNKHFIGLRHSLCIFISMPVDRQSGFVTTEQTIQTELVQLASLHWGCRFGLEGLLLLLYLTDLIVSRPWDVCDCFWKKVFIHRISLIHLPVE